MANASLKVTLSLASTDLFDSISLAKTVTDTLTIDGDNRQGLTTMKTTKIELIHFFVKKLIFI